MFEYLHGIALRTAPVAAWPAHVPDSFEDEIVVVVSDEAPSVTDIVSPPTSLPSGRESRLIALPAEIESSDRSHSESPPEIESSVRPHSEPPRVQSAIQHASSPAENRSVALRVKPSFVIQPRIANRFARVESSPEGVPPGRPAEVPDEPSTKAGIVPPAESPPRAATTPSVAPRRIDKPEQRVRKLVSAALELRTPALRAITPKSAIESPVRPATQGAGSSPDPQPAPETVVHVHIGRVEVRASAPARRSDAPVRPASRSLEDYLGRANGGKSS